VRLAPPPGWAAGARSGVGRPGSDPGRPGSDPKRPGSDPGREREDRDADLTRPVL